MKWTNSIAFRLSASIAIVVMATALTVASLILSEERAILENHLRIRALQLAEIMSQQIVDPLLYEEQYTIYSIFESYINPEDSIIVYAEAYDLKGTIHLTNDRHAKVPPLPFTLSTYGTKATFVNLDAIGDGKSFDLIAPITTPNLGVIGYLRLGITPSQLLATLENIEAKTFKVTILIVFSGILAGLWIARRIIKPILVLNHAVLGLEKKNLGEDIEVPGIGEIRELALSFNAMSKKLKESLDSMKQAQDTLIRKEKLYVLGEFSAGLAHEIKNPLTPIKMLIQRAHEQNVPLEGPDLVIINDELKRIDETISQFLGYARIQEPRIENVDVNLLIQDVIHLAKQKVEKSGVEFLLHLDTLTPIKLDLHPDGLKQVIMNLILNALQAMPNGGTLELSTIKNAQEVRIEIKDSGIGMTEEQRQKVFDPFFTTKQNGTGLGLAIVWSIIESFNGKIEFLSEPQQGTQVLVSLPYV